ncbi:50S ribosome-binding GTPase, partial [Candidatus Pacearchaeota archaeon]|nr:50S ribosome-binding GTPase [Candidatus Pacearchaeota archaeon]
MQKINLVMLGHLDHGKSTLIGRILYDTQTLLPDKIKEVESIWKTLGKNNEFAFFLDAFQEEVEEGMTIDTIQVTLKTKKQEYSLIDCPGHKEFTKNMLSGASQASTAILVISARKEEGIQEQTKRHIFLAKMLGIEQLFVVVNKMDAINYDEKRFNEIKQQAEEFLRGIGYAKIFFIPISAKNGENVLTKSENMKWYTGDTLLNIVDNN